VARLTTYGLIEDRYQPRKNSRTLTAQSSCRCDPLSSPTLSWSTRISCCCRGGNSLV